MAIDDVVSDYDNTASADARISIQPASGDEWLITHIFVEQTWSMNAPGETSNLDFGPTAGNTAKTDDWNLAGGGMLKQALLVTNSEYIRMLNNGAGARQLAFSAIKTKD